MNHEEKKRFIAARFPQLQQLTKPGWADAACEVWAKAWEMSTWEDLDKVPANPLTPNASLLNHCNAVIENCIAVAKTRQALFGDKLDMDVLIVSGVLHDATKILEYELRDGHEVVSRLGELYQHSFYAAHLCVEAGFPPEVIHIVHAHTHGSRVLPKTAEAVLFYYCDMVDADLNRFRDHGPSLLTGHK